MIGETLAAARQARGWTIADVSAATRIRSSLIAAIEREDFKGCGGDFYARGHIRNIANVLGIDAAPLIAEFDRQRQVITPQPLTPQFDPDVAHHTKNRGPNWTAAMAVAIAVVCVIAAVQLFSSPGHRGTQSAANETPPVTSGPPVAVKTTTPSPSPAAVPPSAVAQATGVDLRLNVVGDRSWMSVSNSTGQVLFQGILQHGIMREFHDASQLRLTIGNAGAVDVTVNGYDLGELGKPATVAHATYGPGRPSKPTG